MNLKSLFLIATVSLFAMPSSADVTSGLIEHYMFDGNASDVSGNGNDGIPHGSTLAYEPGHEGLAVRFNNDNYSSFFYVNDWVELPNQTLTQFTVSIWIKFSKLPWYQGGAIYTLGSNQAPTSAFRLMATQSGMLAAVIEGGGGGGASASVDISDGEWHHVAASFDGSTIGYYFDGIHQSDTTVNSAQDFTNVRQAVALHWWNNYSSSASRFNGSVDELRLYNRALTSTEIQELAGSTVDDDQDGVENSADACPGTSPNDIVDGSGCSLDQYCGCDGYSTHGGYVGCITSEANRFIGLGLLQRKDKGAIVSDHARTDCGR